jgi:archaellum component FlaC
MTNKQNCNSCDAFRVELKGKLEVLEEKVKNNYEELNKKIDTEIKFSGEKLQRTTENLLSEFKTYKQENSHDREIHNQHIQNQIERLSNSIEKVANNVNELKEKQISFKDIGKWILTVAIASPILDTVIKHLYHLTFGS